MNKKNSFLFIFMALFILVSVTLSGCVDTDPKNRVNYEEKAPIETNDFISYDITMHSSHETIELFQNERSKGNVFVCIFNQGHMYGSTRTFVIFEKGVN